MPGECTWCADLRAGADWSEGLCLGRAGPVPASFIGGNDGSMAAERSRPGPAPGPRRWQAAGEQTASFTVAVCWSDWRASCAVPSTIWWRSAGPCQRQAAGDGAVGQRLQKQADSAAAAGHGTAGVDEVLLQRLQPSGGGHQPERGQPAPPLPREGTHMSGPPHGAGSVGHDPQGMGQERPAIPAGESQAGGHGHQHEASCRRGTGWGAAGPADPPSSGGLTPGKM